MSYFRVIVDKDKFSLYDTSKDKYYTVEPDDIDHILDSENPYNDDGSLNLKSYSDVINYFNRKNSKNKTSKALTRGYTSKKANLKKEYQAISASNRKDLLRRKLLAQNVEKNIIDKIVKYPTKDVVNDLRVDDNTRRILTDIIEDVDTVAPLDETEKTSINSKYVDENKLEDKKNTIQDRNNLIINAYNVLQGNQRTMLNSLRNIRNAIPDLDNLPDYTRPLLQLNNKLNELTDTVTNGPLSIDYQANFNAINQQLADLNRQIEDNPNRDYTAAIKAIADNVEASKKLITDGFDEVNNRPQIDYTEKLQNIEKNTQTLINTIKKITPPNQEKREIQPMEEIKKEAREKREPMEKVVNEPTNYDYDDEENELHDKFEEKRVNLNDNIERTVRSEKPTVSQEWSSKYTASPIEVLRKRSYRNQNTGPAHSLLKLLNNLNDMHETPVIKITKEKDPGKKNTYSLNTLGNYDDGGYQFDLNFGTNAPFKRIITQMLDKYNGKKIDAKTLLNEFVNTITEEAKSSDLSESNVRDAYMHVSNMNGNDITAQQIEFASRLPSATTTVTFEGSLEDVEDEIQQVLDNNYNWNDHEEEKDKYVFRINSKKIKDDSKENIYDPTSENIYHVLERNENEDVDYSSMDEGNGLASAVAKILGRTINKRLYKQIPNKSGSDFALSSILANSINNM